MQKKKKKNHIYEWVVTSLREKCANTEYFWSVFSHIRTEITGPEITPYLDTYHAVIILRIIL